MIKPPRPHSIHAGNAFFRFSTSSGTSPNDERAIASHSAAIEQNPQYADAYYNRGNLYLKQKRVEEGIADLSTAVQLKPNHSDGYANRGIGHALKGDRNKAISDFQKALEINPGNEAARRNLQALGIGPNAPTR